MRWDSKSLHHLEGNQFDRYSKEYILNENVVFDRSHISEIIYSQMWRGGSPFSKNEEKFLDYLSNKNSLIIFTNPPIEKIKERYLSRNYDQQISLNELNKSRELFIKKFENLDFIEYNSKNLEELNKIVNLVLGKIK